MPNAYIPNSFQTPNILVDEILPLLTPPEWIVLSFATRQILGWHDRIHERQAPISLSRFEACGLNRQAILPALAALERFGLLRKVGSPDHTGQVWRLNYDEGVDLEGLRARQHERMQRSQNRTRAARYAGHTRSVPHTGLSHIPPKRMSHIPNRGMSDIPNKTQGKTQDQTHIPSATSVAAGDGTISLPLFSNAETNIDPNGTSALPALTVGTAAPSTPGSAPPPPSPHVALIDAYLAALPAKPIERGNPYGRYGAIASALVKAGITPAQIVEFVQTHSQAQLWVGKCIPLEYVARHLNAWLQTKGEVHVTQTQVSSVAFDSRDSGTRPPDFSRPKPLPGVKS